MTTTDLTPTPTDLSPDEAEERGRRAYELDQEVKAGIQEGREALWRVARALYEFSEMSGWTALGHDTLGEWLADPEVSMTRTTFHRMVGVWRELVVLRKLPESEVLELEASKVDIVLPAVKAGRVTLKKALKDVRALGARDLREEYLSRPEPRPAPQPGETPSDTVPEPSSYMDPPVNDGTDTPTSASTGERVPTSGSTSNGPIDASEDPDGFRQVIEGTATVSQASPMVPDEAEAERQAHPAHILHPDGTITPAEAPPVPQEATEPQGMPQDLQDAIRAAGEVLAQPQRLAGNRQAVRAALEALITAVEKHFTAS